MEQKKLEISSLFEGIKTFVKEQFKRLDTWAMISCWSYFGGAGLIILSMLLIALNVSYFIFNASVIFDAQEKPLVFIGSILATLVIAFLVYKISKKAIGISNVLMLNALAAAENKILPKFSIRDERLSFFLYVFLYFTISILGLICLIIPGIIFFVRSLFGYLIMLDEKCSPFQALQRSWNMTEGYFWQIFIFAVPMWIILSLIPLIGIIFLFIPLNVLVFAYLYTQIKGQRQA